MWNSGANKDEMLAVIAKDAGMDLDATATPLEGFVFRSIADQLSGKWLGGGSQEFMKGVADVFVSAGSIDAALDTYAPAVNTGPLTSAQGM